MERGAVVDRILCKMAMLTAGTLQLMKGLTVQGWPHGHARDLEDTIRFAELQKVDCLIEKFPFDKANEAFGACYRVIVMVFFWCRLQLMCCRQMP